MIDILRWFWESHDPTADCAHSAGRTRFRSGLYYQDMEQRQIMEISRQAYQSVLERTGKGCHTITTEIVAAASFQHSPGDVFYFAEEEHQQYLAKPGVLEAFCKREVKGSLQPLGMSLPLQHLRQFELLDKHAPKLSEEFWRRYAPAVGARGESHCLASAR